MYNDSSDYIDNNFVENNDRKKSLEHNTEESF